MKSFTVFILAIATVAVAQINAITIWEDHHGNAYYLVSLDEVGRPANHRQVRSAYPQHETSYDIGNKHVALGQKYTFENDNHKFSGNVYGSRDYAPKGPLTTGQGVEYQHKPSNSNFELKAQNTRGYGTDVSASGTYNFLQTQDKRGNLGVGGGYQQHFGGPWGKTNPNYNVHLKGTYAF